MGEKVCVTETGRDVSSVWFSLKAYAREIVELGDRGSIIARVIIVAIIRDETSDQ